MLDLMHSFFLVGLAMLAAFLAASQAAVGAATQPGEALKTLRPAHPRLLLLPDRWAWLKQAIEKDPRAAQWHKALLADAGKMLDQKVAEHVLKGPRMLDQSRAALRRISTLAALYRLDGDKRFAERARAEMLAAAAFQDWNPSHFLDVAEMTNALGLGYDWLFDFLSEQDRKVIRTAIVEKGLKPGLEAYRTGVWWTKVPHNWSQVCNGGLTVGALAIADEEPALAAQIVADARAAIAPSLTAFAPDGGFPEGPGYWAYATEYQVFYLAALRSALGTDFGQADAAGFAQAGFFRIQCISPINRTFNFADAADGPPGKAPQMLWLAEAFNEPAFAYQEAQYAGRSPAVFDLLFYSPKAAEQLAAYKPDWPIDALFQGANVAFFRGAWNDPKALFVGFKGGNNAANHAHLDLGTFVLDAGGYRWALDLGSDDYDLPGYFGKERWTYYRLRTEGHNTLTLDDQNQNVAGKAPLVAFHSEKDRAFAVADLSDGYRGQARRVQRGIAVLGRQMALVQDEIEAAEAVAVAWNLHTPAKIELQADGAILTQDKTVMRLRVLTPQGVKFAVLESSGPAPQAQSPQAHNLVIRLPEKVKETRIVVLLSQGEAEAAAPRIEPLEAWIKAGKN